MSKEVNEERAPRTVTDVKEMLTKHSNGEIQRTIQNCITILQNDHVLADAIRLNLLSERIDIVKPVGWPRSGKTLSDTDMKYILRRMEKYGISSEKKIESAIRIVANENRYHPIRDYLNSLRWDGTLISLIDSLCTLETALGFLLIILVICLYLLSAFSESCFLSSATASINCSFFLLNSSSANVAVISILLAYI